MTSRPSSPGRVCDVEWGLLRELSYAGGRRGKHREIDRDWPQERDDAMLRRRKGGARLGPHARAPHYFFLGQQRRLEKARHASVLGVGSGCAPGVKGKPQASHVDRRLETARLVAASRDNAGRSRTQTSLGRPRQATTARPLREFTRRLPPLSPVLCHVACTVSPSARHRYVVSESVEYLGVRRASSEGLGIGHVRATLWLCADQNCVMN